MGSQHYVTGGHTGAAAPAQWLVQVHLGLLKELLQLLRGEHQAVLFDKFVKGHTFGAWDVAWLDTCGTNNEV